MATRDNIDWQNLLNVKRCLTTGAKEYALGFVGRIHRPDFRMLGRILIRLHVGLDVSDVSKWNPELVTFASSWIGDPKRV